MAHALVVRRHPAPGRGELIEPGAALRRTPSIHQPNIFSVANQERRAPERRPQDMRAQTEDVHELASRMPHVTVTHGPKGNPVYQVGGKSFVFFRTPRPDAFDPETGERYPDVILFWVPSEADKMALVQDADSPFFTTSHFDGHLSVLVRASRLGELTLTELTEIVQDAWLSRASPSRARAWLAAQSGCPADQ
jgi:hypothetical protein